MKKSDKPIDTGLGACKYFDMHIFSFTKQHQHALLVNCSKYCLSCLEIIFFQYHNSLIKRTAKKRILITRKSAQTMLSTESSFNFFCSLQNLKALSTV